MQLFEEIVGFLESIVWWGPTIGEEQIPIAVIMLLGTGLFLTVRLGFIQLRRLGHGFAVTSGRYDDPDETRMKPIETKQAIRSGSPFKCPGQDLNLHGVTRYHLKVVRLPIPPPGRGFDSVAHYRRLRAAVERARRGGR